MRVSWLNLVIFACFTSGSSFRDIAGAAGSYETVTPLWLLAEVKSFSGRIVAQLPHRHSQKIRQGRSIALRCFSELPPNSINPDNIPSRSVGCRPSLCRPSSAALETLEKDFSRSISRPTAGTNHPCPMMTVDPAHCEYRETRRR